MLQLWLQFHFYHEHKSWTRASVSEAAALLLLLYLPGGNHCGGSSEPARVASSWVLTPPTQSYPPPRLWFGSPPLVPGWTLGVPGWNLFLRKLPGCSPPDGLRLSRAAAARRRCPGAPTDPLRSQMWRQRKKRAGLGGCKCLVCLFYLTRPRWCCWKRALQSLENIVVVCSHRFKVRGDRQK